MWLIACALVVLLSCCSAEIIENKRKAEELNLLVSLAFHEKIEREGPALKELVEKQALECEAKLNSTFEVCQSCRARYENIPEPNQGSVDQLLILIDPKTFGDVTGNPIGTIVRKTIPSVVKDAGGNLETVFKGTIPKIGKDIKKELRVFFTRTLPNVGKFVGNHLETFFKKTVPKTRKKVGKHLDIFFSDTIPKAGKNAGAHLNRFFTKTLPSTGKDVGKSLNTFFKKTVPKTGRKVEHFFKKTIPKVGKKVETFFKRTIPGIFRGRRRRQVSQCPACDKIEIESMTSVDIMRTVCGQAYVNNVAQYRKMATINKLIHVDKKPVITKVTFMRKDVVNKLLEGIASASPFAVTYTDGRTSEILKSDNTLDLLDPNQILGEELAKEIWDMF
ncbi:uncharacterized protein LOC117332797 [Pecten maximus]|uniref:uncharacterized protein LOC117332797 n=1 Tax=Pecten maximus TaxID=6579 RepID=UPI001458B638|nr:uncharacterized protein LOC117332797 [Pecten maximus]